MRNRLYSAIEYFSARMKRELYKFCINFNISEKYMRRFKERWSYKLSSRKCCYFVLLAASRSSPTTEEESVPTRAMVNVSTNSNIEHECICYTHTHTHTYTYTHADEFKGHTSWSSWSLRTNAGIEFCLERRTYFSLGLTPSNEWPIPFGHPLSGCLVSFTGRFVSFSGCL